MTGPIGVRYERRPARGSRASECVSGAGQNDPAPDRGMHHAVADVVERADGRTIPHGSRMRNRLNPMSRCQAGKQRHDAPLHGYAGRGA